MSNDGNIVQILQQYNSALSVNTLDMEQFIVNLAKHWTSQKYLMSLYYEGKLSNVSLSSNKQLQTVN